VVAIDPALLIVEPLSLDLPQHDDSFPASESSGNGSEVDDVEDENVAASAPLFSLSLEPLVQDEFFCP